MISKEILKANFLEILRNFIFEMPDSETLKQIKIQLDEKLGMMTSISYDLEDYSFYVSVENIVVKVTNDEFIETISKLAEYKSFLNKILRLYS